MRLYHGRKQFHFFRNSPVQIIDIIGCMIGIFPKHKRRSIRLSGYDYSQNGAYFVTICTYNREYLFGEIVDRQMIVNELGNLVLKTWHDLPHHNVGIGLNAFVIMPNHIHGIVEIVGAGSKPALSLWAGLEPAPTLSEIVRQLKTFSARKINQSRNTPGQPVWQRNYYEHIIRNENDYFAIVEYILNNPLKWEIDEYYKKIKNPKRTQPN